jgi:hypothetical protein
MWHANESRMHTGCWCQRQKERELDYDRRIILKCTLEKWDGVL